ncbi:MAG: hypothetical protein LBM09_01795, partial [Candidatus Nomurabacteria bacterium]|nr:hypothetical protein [Candidatus Nomurabacteria bacterium]
MKYVEVEVKNSVIASGAKQSSVNDTDCHGDESPRNDDRERFILAKSLVEKVLTDEKNQLLEYKVSREIDGAELVGEDYEPIMEQSDQELMLNHSYVEYGK